MVNTIKLVFKGILLYTTLIVCILSVAGIDSIYDKGYFLIDIVICTGLVYSCYKIINKEEINILALTNNSDKELEENNKW